MGQQLGNRAAARREGSREGRMLGTGAGWPGTRGSSSPPQGCNSQVRIKPTQQTTQWVSYPRMTEPSHKLKEYALIYRLNNALNNLLNHESELSIFPIKTACTHTYGGGVYITTKASFGTYLVKMVRIQHGRVTSDWHAVMVSRYVASQLNIWGLTCCKVSRVSTEQAN
jgi:hypothetical protein